MLRLRRNYAEDEEVEGALEKVGRLHPSIIYKRLVPFQLLNERIETFAEVDAGQPHLLVRGRHHLLKYWIFKRLAIWDPHFAVGELNLTDEPGHLADIHRLTVAREV